LNSYASILLDFKEDFTFQQNENGNKDFSHSLSFGLQSGNSKNKAIEIASGLFAADKDTTFGIVAMFSGVGIADTGSYQNYYTESYDLLRNSYSFSKKREVLPVNATPYVYNLNHSIDMREDGIFSIEEKGDVQGKLTFNQAYAGADSLISAAFTRCNGFYNTYKNFVGQNVTTLNLISAPVKITKTLNKPSLSTTYAIEFTNNPLFNTNGTTTEEVVELDADPQNIVDIKHKFNFTINKRNPPVDGFLTLMDDAVAKSQSYIPAYYAASNFYSVGRPINLIKDDFSYPSNKSKASMTLNYSSNPRYIVVINGKAYNVLDYTVSDTKPIDIINEYKVINRPDKTSVLNYAYQTEQGDRKSVV
jgi:hypothetical protein